MHASEFFYRRRGTVLIAKLEADMDSVMPAIDMTWSPGTCWPVTDVGVEQIPSVIGFVNYGTGRPSHLLSLPSPSSPGYWTVTVCDAAIDHYSRVVVTSAQVATSDPESAAVDEAIVTPPLRDIFLTTFRRL